MARGETPCACLAFTVLSSLHAAAPAGSEEGECMERQCVVVGVLWAMAAIALGSQGLGNLYKAALTQRGYIQFLKYEVDVPPLIDFAFCLWLRSSNFTYPHPVFSYSREETQRVVRAWLEPWSFRLNLLEMPVIDLPLPIVIQHAVLEGRWLHVCGSWDGRQGRWKVFLQGELAGAGRLPQLRGLRLPPLGDLVLGQEYTDFDKGLDDGVEGEVFGFNVAVSALPEDRFRRAANESERSGKRRKRRKDSLADALARLTFARCSEGRGSPASAVLPLLVSWASTPVRVFGGAVLRPAAPTCGAF